MIRIHVDKIASVTRNLRLERSLTLSPTVEVRPGAVVAGRVLNDKGAYNQLEDVHGRMSRLQAGDVIVGALGHRNALHGYEGVMPTEVEAGGRLHVLNLGGVLGRCLSHNPDVGAPFELEVLGQVMAFPDFGSRRGLPAYVGMQPLQAPDALPSCPVVFVAGSCMNAGKTAAACAIVRALRQAGLKVGGTKLTGISLMKDTLAMRDYGAEATLDFTDAGVVCTSAGTSASTARKLLSALGASGVDVIVAETGDGILGDYGVQAILADPALRGLSAAFVYCANDPAGVVGGVRELREAYGIEVDLVAGPATDNQVGVRFVASLGLPARNARTDAAGLGAFVRDLVQARAGVVA